MSSTKKINMKLTSVVGGILFMVSIGEIYLKFQKIFSNQCNDNV